MSDEIRVPIDDKTCVVFDRFRLDGWPLCPRCGEDELYSFLMLQWTAAEPPTIEECLDAGMACYACRFLLPSKERRGPRTIFTHPENYLPRQRESYVSREDCEAFLETEAILPESVRELARQRIIRAEVEAMDWPDTIGE